MNVVVLIGNLAGEPTLRSTTTGKQVCEFRIAVSRPNGEHADFFSVVAWERQAEICSSYLQKGRRVAVEGRLHYSTWEAQDRSKRSKVEVVASRVTLLGPKRQPEPAAQPEEQATIPEPEPDHVEQSFVDEPIPV
jgi:single-strand DNA-binding protein